MASPEKTISNQTNAGPKGMEWKKGGNQGPVERSATNPNDLVTLDVRSGREVEPKVPIKVFQVMGGGKEQNTKLVVFDVRSGRVVEEPKKPVKPHPGEARISLRAGK